jgi:hypothetical protein
MEEGVKHGSEVGIHLTKGISETYAPLGKHSPYLGATELPKRVVIIKLI